MNITKKASNGIWEAPIDSITNLILNFGHLFEIRPLLVIILFGVTILWQTFHRYVSCWKKVKSIPVILPRSIAVFFINPCRRQWFHFNYSLKKLPVTFIVRVLKLILLQNTNNFQFQFKTNKKALTAIERLVYFFVVLLIFDRFSPLVSIDNWKTIDRNKLCLLKGVLDALFDYRLATVKKKSEMLYKTTKELKEKKAQIKSCLFFHQFILCILCSSHRRVEYLCVSDSE